MSIRRRPELLNAKGQPAFIIDYRDEHGRRKQVKTEALTLKEAQGIEAAIRTKIERAGALGVSVQAQSKVTFATFAEGTFFPDLKPNIRETTYRRYWDVYENVKPTFGAMRLGSISPAVIRGYLAGLDKTKTRMGRAPSPREINHRRSLLCAVLQRALEMDYINANPAKAVKPQKVRRLKRHVITEGEEGRLLEAAPAWLKPFITMSIYGGFRESEITLIEWDHVKDGFIEIPEENCKTDQRRAVPLNAKLQAVLDAQDHAIEGGRPIPYVFWDAARKSTFRGNRISERFTKVADRLNIPCTFHSCRATFITRARMAGIKDAAVMAIVGHSSLEMTNLYTNVGREALAGETERLCRKDATPVQHEVDVQEAAV